MNYAQIPSKGQFQKDTNITFATRDLVIKHLDWLLERRLKRLLSGDDMIRQVVEADLYMTSKFWLKSYQEGNRHMRKERLAGVAALFDVAVRTLCQTVGCNAADLPENLAEIYGRDMHIHGVQIDFEQNRANYLTQAQREVYRLRFRSGRAYQYKWWKGDKGLAAGLVPAQSKHAYTAISRNGNDASENFGCFVMTMEREFYMAKPKTDQDGTPGFFHSSFTGGDMITMAGTMLIKDGEIRGMRNDSGHYHPTPMNMGLCLQALAMYGFNLGRITLYAHNGTELGSASEFMKLHMGWYQFEKQRLNERGKRQETDERRGWNGMGARFPNLPPLFPVMGAPQGPPVAPVGNQDSYNALG